VLSLATKEELFDLNQAFSCMDSDNDGLIGIEDMISGFNATTEEEIREVEIIFEEVDID
jgi:Ca2+-binding EF-hand superfamily protein